MGNRGSVEVDRIAIIIDNCFDDVQIFEIHSVQKCQLCLRSGPKKCGGQGRNRTTDTRIFSEQISQPYVTQSNATERSAAVS